MASIGKVSIDLTVQFKWWVSPAMYLCAFLLLFMPKNQHDRHIVRMSKMIAKYGIKYTVK